MSTVVTRFPPSPTGYLHIGRARTALFNYLYAKNKGGKMVFRIEDTDRERSKREYEENIIECLKWLGITYDEGPVRQSERHEIYVKYLQKLIDGGFAFVSKEEPSEAPADGKAQRAEVIRFKNPNKKIVFTDLIRGDIEFDTTELGDFVIAKSLTEPLYHMAVVVDDHEMGVTHVIRGDDGISNTPRQILIQEGIGATRPLYAHIPLILAADKSKLSGRHGAVGVSEYRTKGYLPEAVVNFLGLLGWHPSDDRELFSIDELVKEFTLERVQKSGAVFDEEKLKWFNRQYILKLSDESFTEHAQTFLPEWLSTKSPLFKRLIPVMKDKISLFSEIHGMFVAEGELHFTKELVAYPAEKLLWKKNPSKEASQKHLTEAQKLIAAVPAGEFDAEAIKAAVMPYAEANGRGDVLWPLRLALTGQDKSPDPFMSAAILGQEEAARRISIALGTLSSS